MNLIEIKTKLKTVAQIQTPPMGGAADTGHGPRVTPQATSAYVVLFRKIRAAYRWLLDQLTDWLLPEQKPLVITGWMAGSARVREPAVARGANGIRHLRHQTLALRVPQMLGS